MHTHPAKPDREGGWGTTFAFWGALLAAGTLFAAVSFAPKLLTLSKLDADYAANQLRLVELERQAIELEKVADALEHDPAFAAELAKLEFAAGRTGREGLAVRAWRRAGADRGGDAPELVATAKTRWAVPPALLEPLATNAALRAALLVVAAALVLASFLLFNERHVAAVRAINGQMRAAVRGVTDRYRTNTASKPIPPVRRRAA